MSKKLSRFSKKNEILTILLSVSLGFTVFFFTPAELFIRNQNGFTINAKDMFITLLICALIASAALILLLNLFLLIHEKLHFFMSRLLIGLLLAFYVQELFLNGSMPAITGDTYSVPTWKITLNVILMYFIIILPLVLSVTAKEYPGNKLLNIGKGYAIPYLSAIIFIMQAVGVTSSALQFRAGAYDRIYEEYLSYEPSVYMSDENNIMVFIVDRLDGSYMDEMLEAYPELYDEFEGFTYYRNNVSHYTNTFPAITTMLTQTVYDGGRWNDFFNEAWTGETLLQELKKNGFRVNLFIDNSNTYNDISQLYDDCDNIRSFPDGAISFNYTGEGGIVRTMTKLSLSKLLPYIFKSGLLEGMRSDFSARFLTMNVDIPEAMPREESIEADLIYYRYLLAHPLQTGYDKNFTFIHLRGAHDDYADLQALYNGPVKPGSFPMSTTRGGFEILFTYFRQLKELGIYDNTTILVLGDHGRFPFELDEPGAFGLDSEITTALLIKPANADHETLNINEDAELSNDYFAASILEYAGIDHEAYGYSFNDIIEQDIHTERYMQPLRWRSIGTVQSDFAMYRITGDARDFDNWEIVNSRE